MGRIPDHVVEEIRDRADIVQMIGRHLTLKKSGSRYWGLCPFHTEKTPSFQVHEEKQIFHCFGCGESGDVFAFAMRHDGLDFPDAVRALARELRIPVPSSSGGASSSRVTELYAVNDAALDYFRQSLRGTPGAAARRYLTTRGLTPELIERFQLGFAPAQWDGLQRHLQRTKHREDLAAQAGLIAPRSNGEGHYDRFRGRVLFPICDPSGHVLGFGGRALGEEETPKYLNSPESPIYHKGRVLFGLPLALDAIRRHERIVIVEGYFDLVALHRAGIEEGVAPCGTALTPDHARRLRRYANEVVLLFDGDDAGRRAAERALPILMAEGVRVRAAFLPSGEDPDTIVSQKGAEALRECVDGAQPLLDRLIDQRLAKRGQHAWQVADAAHAVAPLLRALTDPIELATYIRTLAMRLDLPAESLLKTVRGDAAPQKPARAGAPAPAAAAAAGPQSIDPAVRVLLGALASYPELLPLMRTLRAEWLPPGEASELLFQLSAAVRDHGQAALAHLLSPASEGISELVRTTLSRIVADTEPGDLPSAEKAARDCVAQLGIRALDRQSRDLTSRLESCNDPAELETLLQKKQQNLAERRELWSQVQQV